MKPAVFTVSDRSLEPEIPFGSRAVCCPRSTPQSGDFVAYVTDFAGQPIFRRYIEKSDGSILLQAVNPDYDSFTTLPDDFKKRGKVFVILSIRREFRKPDLPLEAEETERSAVQESYLTFAEAQALLKVHRTRMYELLRQGKLKAVKMGRLWRIPRSAVDDCLSGGLR